MKRYSLFALTLFALLTFSCKENTKIEAPSETSQMKQVIAVHDDAMDKMSEISKLVSTLREKIDADQGNASHKKAMEELQDANKSMMDWMQGFGANFDSDEILNGKTLTPAKAKLLDEEEKKVKIVQDKIDTSIANAKALLAE